MRKLFCSIFLILTIFTLAQQTTHTVEAKETIFGLTQKYGISEEQLKAANPFLYDRGLQIGDVLVIPDPNSEPIKEVETPAVEDHEDKDFIYLVIKPKQTVFSLTKAHDISEETLESLNPFIPERGLQIGDVVRIPKKKSSSSDELKTPEGMHEVKAGETVYSISKQYNLEMADIYAANRNIQTEGLKAGSFIEIPKKKSVVFDQDFFKHEVENNETIFAIMNKYDVTLNELIQNNAELQDGLVPGMTLNIPLKKGAKLETMPTEVYASGDAFTDGEINLVWMLPFFLDKPNAFKGERKVSQEFYMGAQLAMEELLKQGKNIKIEVVDTQNNTAQIEEYFNRHDVNKIDAIVGPFYQEMIVHTAQKLNGTKIPIFSPLINSENLNTFKNVYLATPREEHAATLIAEEIKGKFKDQKIWILTTNQEKEVAEFLQNELKDKLKDAEIEITMNPNDLKVKTKMETKELEDGTTEQKEVVEQGIIPVLASENNALGNQFMKVIKDQREYAANIDGFGLYFVPAFDVFDGRNKANIELMKEVGFVYAASRMVNTFGDNEKKILAAFENKYCQKPTKYMALGYDVVYDVVDRMDKSGSISSSGLQKTETRLSSKIGYTKAEDGDVNVNNGLRIIRLSK